MRRALAALLAAALAVTACSDDDGSAADDSQPEAPADGEGSTTTSTTAAETNDVGLDLDDVPMADRDDVVMEAAIEAVEAFWTQTFEDAYGEDFEPLSGGTHPYGPRRDLPRCGGPLRYRQIAQNAFYCPADDLIAWDTDNLTNELLDRFGPFTLVIVAAHEYGHAVQARVPVGGPPIALEQQADCFAGAFTDFVADGKSDVLEVSLDDLNSAVAGFLQLRDAVGTPSTDPAAHGSAFDRIGAFQDGFLNGVDRCVDYEEIYDQGGTTVVDIPLVFGDDGDAPLDPDAPDDIFEITLGSLEAFWSEALPEEFGVEWQPLAPDGRVVAFDADDPSTLPDCPGEQLDPEAIDGTAFTCVGDPDDPGDDIVAFDVDLAAEQYAIGDFAVSGILSRQYSRVVQALLGTIDDSEEASLQADCFSGAWAGHLTNATVNLGGQEIGPDNFVSISAGDLDEAVQSFLLLGESAGVDPTASPFERVAAFRDGFFSGLESCV